MTDVVSLSIQIVASTLSITGLWFMGSKRIIGPVISLVAQGPWLVLNVYCELWGLLPATLAFIVVSARNLIKWRRDAR